MIKPISISLSPNTEPDDVWLAFGLLFRPWKWGSGNAAEQLEKKFADRLGVKHSFAFNSGRSSLLAILESLDLQKGDEVLLQAFTCNAVPNPVMWAGLKPVYVDCNEDDFNIDAEDLGKKVTSKSKVVIAQHTFGLPADMDRIMEICRKHNLILLEDCAHALGATYKGREAMPAGRQVGTFGKAAFFSFSRDKVISSVYGGMAVTNDEALAQKIKEFQKKAGYPSSAWVLQQLLHPVVMNWKVLPAYSILGKYLLVLSQKLHILSKAVHGKEKRGVRPEYFPKRMPNALALLALRQLTKLERFNKHRENTAEAYYAAFAGTSFELPKMFGERKNIFLRFVIKHPGAREIIKKAWKQNLLIGDWYTSVLAPNDTELEKFGYAQGSCPTAEKLAQTTLNLPTHINIREKELRKVIEFVKDAD
jgi:perosamine synthetase